MENHMDVSQKARNRTITCSSNLIPQNKSKGNKVTALERNLASVFLAALLTRPKFWRAPYLLADGAVKECDVGGEADTPRDGEERDSFNKKAYMGNPKQG